MYLDFISLKIFPQDEMQTHRNFFVNLNHCKSILESLESHLDNDTRNKYHPQHSELIKRSSDILDRASLHSQQMSLIASKWMILNRGIEEERLWLKVAYQRLPDLSAVKSTDYQQLMILYQVRRLIECVFKKQVSIFAIS